MPRRRRVITVRSLFAERAWLQNLFNTVVVFSKISIDLIYYSPYIRLMILYRRIVFSLRILATIILAWGFLALTPPSHAHGFSADASGAQLDAPSEKSPGAQHADKRHCHGTGSVCHFQLAMYSGQSEWILRSVESSHGQGSVLRKDRDVEAIAALPSRRI